MTLNPVCENVETAQGVPLTVTGVAQVGWTCRLHQTVLDHNNPFSGENHEES